MNIETPSSPETVNKEPEVPVADENTGPSDKHSVWTQICIGGLLVYAFMSLFGFTESQNIQVQPPQETFTVTKTFYATSTPTTSPLVSNPKSAHKNTRPSPHTWRVMSMMASTTLSALGYIIVPLAKGLGIIAIAGLLLLLIWHQLDVNLAYIHEISKRFSLHKWIGLAVGLISIYEFSSAGFQLIAILAGLWFTGILRLNVPNIDLDRDRESASAYRDTRPRFSTPQESVTFPSKDIPSTSASTLASGDVTPESDVFKAWSGVGATHVPKTASQSLAQGHLLNRALKADHGQSIVNDAHQMTGLKQAPSIASLRGLVTEPPATL